MKKIKVWTIVFSVFSVVVFGMFLRIRLNGKQSKNSTLPYKITLEAYERKVVIYNLASQVFLHNRQNANVDEQRDKVAKRISVIYGDDMGVRDVVKYWDVSSKWENKGSFLHLVPFCMIEFLDSMVKYVEEIVKLREKKTGIRYIIHRPDKSRTMKAVHQKIRGRKKKMENYLREHPQVARDRRFSEMYLNVGRGYSKQEMQNHLYTGVPAFDMELDKEFYLVTDNSRRFLSAQTKENIGYIEKALGQFLFNSEMIHDLLAKIIHEMHFKYQWHDISSKKKILVPVSTTISNVCKEIQTAVEEGAIAQAFAKRMLGLPIETILSMDPGGIVATDNSDPFYG